MQDHEMVSRWQDWMRAEGRSPNTIREYRYALQRLASELDPPRPLAEVTEQDIVVFMARLGKRAHSKQLYLRGFKSFYGWAFARGLVDTDPTAHIRPKAPPERDPDAYSPEEVVALMDAAGTRSERDALAILLCYSLGLRRSEVCKLTPDDIDWSGRRVLVRDSKGGKTRWVEMNAAAEGALEGLRPFWNGTVLGGVDPQWFTMIVNRAARESGLPPERRKAHMLRSAFATNLMNEGADVTVVSKLLGHSRVSTTMRYRKIRDRDRRAAVDMLPVPRRLQFRAALVTIAILFASLGGPAEAKVIQEGSQLRVRTFLTFWHERPGVYSVTIKNRTANRALLVVCSSPRIGEVKVGWVHSKGVRYVVDRFHGRPLQVRCEARIDRREKPGRWDF